MTRSPSRLLSGLLRPGRDGDGRHDWRAACRWRDPEALARWLANTGASSFGDMTASYEDWMRMIQAGWAPSAVMDDTGIKSGVEATF